jgi:hypothetical protein
MATRVLACLGCALTVLLGGCQPTASTQQVRGVVIAVEPLSVARAAGVTVRSVDGRELRFAVAAEVSVTPGHLREHMAQGEPVIVEYRTQGNELLAIRIDDG